MVDSYSIGYVPHRRKRFIMSYSGIEHKLRVFISSKCGGKYTIARKSLQKLLDVTGLVETYVFETDPASSEDTQSAYLDYVDNSNLCIFLVDNADGVPPAVLSEEKRAKDKHLRLLYIFCDENKKEPTPMQEDVRKLQSAKYALAHEFSDIVSKAYDSVMQDVIAVYKKKEELFSVEKSEVEPISAKTLITETYSLPATSFSKYPHVACVLTKNILPVNTLNKEDEETSSTVQSRNLGHDIMAGFRTLVGGEVTDYAEMLTEARQIATGRMAKNAEELGADAVVGMRYASASVMQGAAEVIAYGTAVRFV